MRLSRRTRLASVALVASGSLVLAACGGGGDDEGASSDAVITSYSVQPQNPLVPTNTNEVGGGNIVDLIFAGLISYDIDGESSNEVAESIESEDNQTWTVTLEEGWEFSDGTPVTASSFVDAWNFGANPENEQLSAYFFYPIEGTTADGTIDGGGEEISGLEVQDERTFTITLKQAEADFPGRLGYSAYFPLPESAFEDIEAFGDAPIGNGPYILDGLDDNAEARLLPNESYDGARPAQNGGITLKFYTDPDSAYSDVQAGNLDVLDAVPPSALTTFEDDDAIQAFNQPGSVNSTITIPDSLPGFGDNDEGKLRRQAISRAINREEITDKIFDGSRIPSTDFSSPLMPGYTDEIEGNEVLEFDEAEANRLWDEANDIAEFDGEFVLAYNGDGPGNKEWVEATVNQINNVLDIDAEPQAYATFAELREKVTDRSIGTAFRTGWQPDYPSIYNYLGPIFGTGAGSNDGDYSNQEFDDTIQQASGAQNDEERYQLLADAQAILFEDLPAIPLWNTSIAAAAADGVENVEFNWQNKPELQNITK